MNIEERIKQAAESAVLKIIQGGNWIEPDYRNRVKIPQDFMSEVWSLVDTDAIKRQMAERIEKELADRILNHLASEMASDIKTLLSDKERREALRKVASEHLDEICQNGSLK